MKKTGLILEGGGLRGIYTAGVLDFFMEHGIDMRDVYAVSAGACHACSYLTRQPGRAYRTSTEFLKDRRYCSIYSLLTTGDLFGKQLVYDDLPKKLIPIDNETFLASPSNFRAVVTNCLSGKAEYLQVRDMFRDIDYVRASSSMPFVSRFVKIGGTPYLDGGISDAIPLRRAEKDGYTRNIVVLTRDRAYQKELTSSMGLMRMKYRAYPALIEAMELRHIIYNDTLRYIRTAEEEGRALVIAPSQPLQLGRMEKDRVKLDMIYNLGKKDALEMLAKIKAFLA